LAAIKVDSEAMNIIEIVNQAKSVLGEEFKFCTGNGHVRQDVASQIAVTPLLPFGVTSLWHAFSAMETCEAHKTMWKNLEVLFRQSGMKKLIIFKR
jgi:hypothetical protein